VRKKVPQNEWIYGGDLYSAKGLVEVGGVQIVRQV
jgi:hypothetical protein